MDPLDGTGSFALFGIRVDTATPARATLAIWEAALSQAGIRVVLVDLWTLLNAQREYDLWEALSAADFVYPLADDAAIRRVVHRQHAAVIKPELLLFDLLDAAARANKRVMILAPHAEVDADIALMQRIWPQLQLHGLSRGEEQPLEPDSRLLHSINAVAPELLLLGGNSPWQETFVHHYRDELTIGAAVMLPVLHTALAAIGLRAGMPVTGIGKLRRKAAIDRAVSSTLRPVAVASAEAVGALIQEARDGISDFSNALHTHQTPAALKRLAGISAQRKSIAVRVSSLREGDESSSRWALSSPLARIGPPRLPALPAPRSAGGASSSMWSKPPGLLAPTPPSAPGQSSPSATPAAPSAGPDIASEHTRLLGMSPGVSSPGRVVDSLPPGADSSAAHHTPAPDLDDDDAYQTVVIEAIRNATPANGAISEQPTAALDLAALDATTRLRPPAEPAAGADEPAREDAPVYPGQLAPTTRLGARYRNPETERILATIDDLPPTTQLGRIEPTTPTSSASVTASEPPAAGAAGAAGASGASGTRAQPDAARPSQSAQASAKRITRKYVVRRMPRNIGRQRERPRP